VPPKEQKQNAERDAREWLARAQDALEAGDLHAARRAAINAKQEEPRSVRARELLGLAAYELGQWQEALRELLTFRRLSGRRTQDPAIARCYIERGQTDKAVDLLSDLARGDVDVGIWARAQAIRAEALTVLGRQDVATLVLDDAGRAVPQARELFDAVRARLQLP